MWDVAVVGAGPAGCAAALAAARDRAAVLLLESEPVPGGNSRISAGLVALAGTGLQMEAAVEDGPDRLFNDLRATDGGANDPALVRAYADGQAELQAWFRHHGINFIALERGAGQSVARAHLMDAAATMDALTDAVRANGVTLRIGVRVLRLRRASRGLQLETRHGTEVASAVVLATGGFAGFNEPLATFAPEQMAAIRVGVPGCRGDGLGARRRLARHGQHQGHFRRPCGERRCRLSRAAGLLHGWDRGGSRRAALRQRGAALQADRPSVPGATRQDGVPGLRRRCHATERTRLATVRPDGAAPDLPGLARLCGIDPGTLGATVAEYNDGIAAGRDVWDRTGLCNGSGVLVPLRRLPFYAFPCGTALLATYCGLRVDPQEQVLDVWKRPIEGLFAAGEVAGGFHGTAYMTGAALGAAAFFGGRAGRAAANHASESQKQQGRST